MEEYGKATHEDNTSTKESDGKSSKRKTRALPHMGGLAAAEGSIWQRDRETPPTEQKRPLFEATKSDKSAPIEQTLSITPKTAEQPVTQAEIEADERLSNLTPEESRQVALRYAEMRATELAEEAAAEPTDPAERAATEADMELVAALRDRLQADQTTPPSEAIAGAYNETLEHVREPSPQSPTGENTPPPPPLPPGRFVMFPNEPPQSLPAPEAAAPAADTITLTEAAYYERQAENRGLLVGGIIGYLLGRRRGRIKTEKRLLPVQHKLEKQVVELHRSIADKEREIRTVAAQKARQALLRPQSELTPNQPRIDKREHSADVNPVAVPTEILPPQPTFAAAEALPAKPEYHPEQLQQLSSREIQELSKKIIIDGTSVHKIYESKRITESGLRRVVHEYLRGQDVKKVLEQEMLIKELTYERDPRIRNSMSAATSSATTAPVLPLAAAAVQLAQLPAFTPTEPATTIASQSPVSASAAAPRAAYSPEQTIMRAWVAIIVLLAVIAVVLILK